MADRRQTVRYDDRRPARDQAAQPLLDHALGVDVDVGGRFVQHQHPRVGDQRAGKGHELALARRELRSALAHLQCRSPRQGQMNLSVPTARAASRRSASQASGRPKQCSPGSCC